MKPYDTFRRAALQSILNVGTLSLCALCLAGISAANADTTVRQVSSSLPASFSTSGIAGPELSGVQTHELAADARPGETAGPQPAVAGPVAASPRIHHRSQSREHGGGPSSGGAMASPRVKSSAVSGSNPQLGVSFEAINHHDQRRANGGNQWSVEPPDQGLCAGNGFVMESVNDVLRIYDTSGTPVTGVIDLNTFYGYPAAINRTTGDQGPFLTDPSCYYDADTQRWFQVVLTLDIDAPTGNYLGSNHLDVAVSASANPAGSWVIYRLPVQDDGTQGTPDHGCSLNPDGTGHGPCLGDYPHIGADKNGFYITTNEYSFFGPEFKSAQIYAFSKSALAANASSVTVVQLDTAGLVKSVNGTQPGFTVWPAVSPAGNYFTDDNGVEFFMSTNSATEATGLQNGPYFSNELVVWGLSNTTSLNSIAPNLRLANKVVRSEVYGMPPLADQKTGDVPLADCLNVDCLGYGLPATAQVEGVLDALDARMQQVWYANGALWSAFGTTVTVAGQEKAGIAYASVSPDVGSNGRIGAQITRQGYLALAGNNLTMPAVAMLPDGKGVMGFTLVGTNHYPSAAYAMIGDEGPGAIHIAANGAGPQDGFSEYADVFGSGPRWGDYGAAVSDGNQIWIANEYIAQTCTFAGYLADTSCGGTRTALANWATRISNVAP